MSRYDGKTFHEAFHLSFCNPRVKKIPDDEWFCHSCSKKPHKILNGVTSTSPYMIGEEGRCVSSSIQESKPIISMVRDTGPYSSGVRCGKGFQAEVPEWSGPITKAPLFEVETDKWECFCCVDWDPFHADCATPQEPETDQVLKQLKYIQMLGPRLEAKRLEHMKKKNDSTEDLKQQQQKPEQQKAETRAEKSQSNYNVQASHSRSQQTELGLF